MKNNNAPPLYTTEETFVPKQSNNSKNEPKSCFLLPFLGFTFSRPLVHGDEGFKVGAVSGLMLFEPLAKAVSPPSTSLKYISTEATRGLSS